MLLQSGWREARTVVGVQVPQEPARSGAMLPLALESGAWTGT
jgi:hypothetical protein